MGSGKCGGSILGFEEAEFVAIVARGEENRRSERCESIGGDLRTWNALQRNFDVVPVVERPGGVLYVRRKLELVLLSFKIFVWSR